MAPTISTENKHRQGGWQWHKPYMTDGQTCARK